METIFWIGPYKDYNLGLIKIPGLLLSEYTDQPCLQYKFKLYNETVIMLYLSVYICIFIILLPNIYLVITMQSTYKSCGAL